MCVSLQLRYSPGSVSASETALFQPRGGSWPCCSVNSQIRLSTTCRCGPESAGCGPELCSTSRSSAANFSCHTHRRYSHALNGYSARQPRAPHDFNKAAENQIGIVAQNSDPQTGSVRLFNKQAVIFDLYYRINIPSWSTGGNQQNTINPAHT